MEERCHDLINYFNGILSSADRDAFEAHLATCEECREALLEMEELMLPIAESLPERPVPVGMKARILGEVLGSAETESPKEEPMTTPVDIKQARQQQTKKKSVPLGWLMSIAAALILSLGANAYFLSQEESTDTPETLAMDEIKGMGNFESNESIKGSSMVFTQNDKSYMLVQLKDLPPLKEGELYQLWTIKGETPTANGIIEKDGEAAAVFPLKGNGDVDAVAITVEPEPDLAKPTGEIVASVAL